jgi:hypothetical protein
MGHLRLLAVLLAAATLGAATMTAGGADAAVTRRCKDLLIRNASGGIFNRTTRLRATRTTCRVARRVARGYLTATSGAPRPYGYRCRGTTTGVLCTKGLARVSWRSFGA